MDNLISGARLEAIIILSWVKRKMWIKGRGQVKGKSQVELLNQVQGSDQVNWRVIIKTLNGIKWEVVYEKEGNVEIKIRLKNL